MADPGFALNFYHNLSKLLQQCLSYSPGTFSVVFFTLMFGYGSFAYFIFGRRLWTYRTFISTTETLLSVMLGSFNYRELVQVEPTLGPVFFFTLVMFEFYLFLEPSKINPIHNFFPAFFLANFVLNYVSQSGAIFLEVRTVLNYKVQMLL